MKQAKRWLSGLLAALLVVGLLPATAGAYSMGMQGTAQTVAAGQFHSLAVKADGSLWAWGWNGSGQLGDGTTEDRHTPVKVMDDVATVAAGDGFSLAVKTDGSLWAWGYGLEGVRSTPAKVLDNVAVVSAGHSHALAVKTDGSAWAWGWNDYGQLGDGTTTKRTAPVKIMDDVMAVAAGYADSLAIQTDGSLWAWGATAGYEAPKRMLENVAAASIGINHTVAVMPNGEWWAWGQNDSGQLGSGSHAFDAEMYGYKMADNAVASTAGNAYTLVVKADDSLWGWGANSLGQLGAGVKGTQFSPVKVTENVVTASAGYNHSLVLKTDGSLWASGCNEDYQLGDGTQTSRGTLVKVMDDVKLPGTSSVAKPVSPQEPSAPGTSQAVGDNTSSGAAEKPPVASHVEDVEMIRSFDFSGGTDYESAEITGTDAQGNKVWTYTTDQYVSTECARTGEIGVYQGMYLFFDGGAITALDAQTGDVVWRNGDYGGTGTAYLIDGDTLYACGQYGPDFYAIDMAGNTLTRIEQLDNEYYWADQIKRIDDDVVAVEFMESDGSYSSSYRIYINCHDYSHSRIMANVIDAPQDTPSSEPPSTQAPASEPSPQPDSGVNSSDPSSLLSDFDQVRHKEAVSTLVEMGIIRGFPDGTYGPEQCIDRGSWAKLLAEPLSPYFSSDDWTYYLDVYTELKDIEGNWAESYIKYLYIRGIICGDNFGNYNSTNDVTVVEAAKTILVAIGLDADSQGYTNNPLWAENIMKDAKHYGLLTGLNVYTFDSLTRDDAAQMIYNALDELGIKEN